MKKKLNLTELTKKELKAMKGGQPVCFCVCYVGPSGSSNIANTLTYTDY